MTDEPKTGLSLRDILLRSPEDMSVEELDEAVAHLHANRSVNRPVRRSGGGKKTDSIVSKMMEAAEKAGLSPEQVTKLIEDLAEE